MMGTFAMSLESNRLRAKLILFLYCSSCAGAPPRRRTPLELRYRLKTGDRFVYREVFDRQGKSPDTSFHSRTILSNQVMVMGSANGSSLVGIQRNRRSADLLEFRDHGKDVLALQKPAFELRVAARPARLRRLQCILCRWTRAASSASPSRSTQQVALPHQRDHAPADCAHAGRVRMELRHLWTSDEA